MCFAVLWRVSIAQAQLEFHVVTANSLSGQFTAQERVRTRFYADPASEKEGNFLGYSAYPLATHSAAIDSGISLEPAPLVISCERIKERFLATLDLRDNWRSKIDLLINPNLPSNSLPTLAAVSQPIGWVYQVQLPKNAKPREIIRGVVGALLLELANRNGGTQSAEVPLWLIEGMCAHLEANNLPTFLLENAIKTVSLNVHLDGEKEIQQVLQNRAPLTFQQLSWPDALRTDADRAVFRACSQLFLEDLLRLPDGRAALRSMISQLGSRMNWQTAFLSAFHADFPAMLDVEKWWSVNCIAFGGGSGRVVNNYEGCRQLQSTLDVPVKIHLDSGRLPARAVITMQEMLMTWDNSQATAMLQRAVFDLAAMRLRVTAELRPIVEGYFAALQSYLAQEQSLEKKANVIKNPGAAFLTLKKSTCKQLDSLDRQRAGLRAKFPPARSGPELRASNPLTSIP